VIYELDTPIVSDNVATDTLAYLAQQSLGSLFTATDPARRSIAAWQVYNTATSDALTFAGSTYQDHSAASALTAASLASVDLLAGSTATTDTLEVRAYNGSYWGDWQSLNVSIAATAPSPPVLMTQTAAQTWKAGTSINLALPVATFADPQNEALTYSAQLFNGLALPAWLQFNPMTDTFSGMTSPTAQTLTIIVTARDTSGLSVADTFTATVLGAPQVTSQTANQTWTESQAIALVLPTNTFTDPQNQGLSYTATQANGQALPGWLSFNPTTETFSGTAPATQQNLSIKVTATDSSGLAASETFSAIVQAAPPPVLAPAPATIPLYKNRISLTAPTPNQTWSDKTAVNFVLPANTFTDALGLKMTFAASQFSGPNATSWLFFQASTDTFSGIVPASASGKIGIEVVARDALGMTAVDLFTVTLAPASGHSTSAATAGSIAAVTSFHAPSLIVLRH
jgi:hypothetical protein